MAIALRGTAVVGSNDNSASSTSIALPTGTTIGDLTIIFGVHTGGNGPTLPSGWIILESHLDIVVGYRINQSGDPTTVTISDTAGTWWESASISFRGVDGTTPIDGFNSSRIYLSTNITSNPLYRAPSLNPNFTTDQLVCLYAATAQNSGTGFTLRGSLTSQASSNSGPRFAIADAALSSGAATGDYDATTAAATPITNYGAQILLAPAGGTASALGVPTITVASLHATDGSASSITIALDNVEDGDLVVFFYGGTAAITSAPSGYTLQQSISGGGSAAYSHAWKTSDATSITFTLASSIFYSCACYTLRASSGFTADIDVSGSTKASGTSSVTSAAVTIPDANNYLLVWFGDAPSSGGTWTADPTGLTTIDVVSGYGPCYLTRFCITHIFTRENSTYSATLSLGDTVGAIALAISAPTVGGGGGFVGNPNSAVIVIT